MEKFKILMNVQNNETGQEQKAFLEKLSNEDEKCIEDEFDEDTRCGFGFLKGKWLQKLASKKTFLFVHIMIEMIFSSTFHYYSGTLSTLEKHYKFSSTQTGYIGSVYDMCATIASLFVPYYCSKGHFPRWLGFSVIVFVISFAVYTLPYFLFGAGKDALLLTEEYGSGFNLNSTKELIQHEKMKDLCYANSENSTTAPVK